MKKLTKMIAAAAAVAVILFSTESKAQSTTKLGIGLNGGIPTNDGHGFALGGDLRLQFDVSKRVSIPVTTGYTHFFGKDNVPDFGYIPAKAGVKVFLNDTGSGAYGSGELGAAFGTNEGGGTRFLYSPSLGYAWSNGLDLSVKYEGLPQSGNNIGQVGLRLAYGFKL
ncbi:hypothetical protein [Pedobacter sp. SYP-B3415]|uniref:hypothetical protein n=1 Tax=Pedobacter sp. SYP-B3415 TaxID=2496641 RepID=UPI00101D1B90|nr:hypothetical protein [Pedobacter sp. SYP-B3415]